MARWDEYNAVATPEARLAKGLDRLETVLQHVAGRQSRRTSTIAFNLGYGRAHTDAHPLIAALRAPGRRRDGAAGPRRSRDTIASPGGLS